MRVIQEHPLRHAITVEEYLRMAEAHVFAPQARLELMEGEIVEMAPIGSAHAAIVNTLAALLARSGERAIVSVQNPLVVGEHSVPQPDVVLLRPRADRYFSSHPLAADAFLVAEVSDSTLSVDLNFKVPLYARAGVRELWVLDIDQRVVHVFRDPDEDRYRRHISVSGENAVSVTALNGLSVTVAELFPPVSRVGTPP